VLSVAALIASLAFLGLVIAAIPALLQLRRTAHTAEQTLAAVERELRPLTSQLQGLLQDHRELAQRASRDLREVEGLALMAREILLRLIKLTGLLGSVATVGRVLGVAQGLRKGVDVFISRLSKSKRSG
jgi:DNA-binding transcriptional MerR regulator